MRGEPSAVVRPLNPDDLPAALRLQAAAYPAFLQEDAAAFASRLDVTAPYCFAATRDRRLLGYLLAHGWPRESPPAVGAFLRRDAPSEVLYIHDLTVDAGARGMAIGEQLIAGAVGLAARDGLQLAELIAVAGAAGYCERLGFADAACPDEVAAKVRRYGPGARWMRRAFFQERGAPAAAPGGPRR
jgi:GNAT superfamily N-acetyltransferase